MSDTNWKYTAAERRAIDDAFSAVAYMMDTVGHRQPIQLAARGETLDY